MHHLLDRALESLRGSLTGYEALERSWYRVIVGA